jgi:hypothetical protein
MFQSQKILIGVRFSRLFYEAVSISENRALNGRKDLEGSGQIIMKVLFQKLTAGTQKYHEILHLEY